MKFSIPYTNLSDSEVNNMVRDYLSNPYTLVVKKSSKRLSKVLTLEDELYHGLKRLFLTKPVEDVIAAIVKIADNELYYSKQLFLTKDGWEREVPIRGIGRIDGLHRQSKLLVELKFCQGWKGAFGQVLSYGYFYPDFRKEIWLLGLLPNKTTIEDVCAQYQVGVQWIST